MEAVKKWVEREAQLAARLNLSLDPGRGEVRINIPERANIAADTVGSHARGTAADRLALVYEEADGTLRRYSFGELDEQAARLAASLRQLGVQQGQPVAVALGQRPEAALAHLAIYKLGAIVVTVSHLYGADTFRHILQDSAACVLVADGGLWQRFRHLNGDLPHLRHRIVVGARGAGDVPFSACLQADAAGFRPVDTLAEDPALLLYTSGSTGLPKGILHAHRILQAYLPTVALFYDLDIEDPGAVFWTPADWAWVGGLLDLVLPAWAWGHTVAASDHRFQPEWAFGFMARHAVTHTFMTPTALTRLSEEPDPRGRWPLKLRVVATGGEKLSGVVFEWAEHRLGVVCNEFYGLTEVNHLVGNCRRLYPARPGATGTAYPGHRTTVVDESGLPVPDGQVGEIVAGADDPTLFLGYWPERGIPDRLRLGEWIRTHDLAIRDQDGYFWYQGRNDDLIKSAGYRIGPVEVESALMRHPAVAEAAVIGKPDATRGAVVKAFVRLKRGVEPGETLVRELQEFVKENVAAYKYPREIEFVDSFPLTSTGKIHRRELRRREAAGGPALAAGESDGARDRDRVRDQGRARDHDRARDQDRTRDRDRAEEGNP